MSTWIKGIGGYLPERVVTSEELEEMAGYKDHGVKLGLCKMLTGCASRHWAAKDELCSDIAARAGEIAMKEAGVEPQDVDAILFTSVTQDFVEPATANVVADKLNIRNGFAFDVKNACNAFLSGVDIADSFIATGKAETVLVVSGECLSKWTKLHYDDKEELIQRAPVALSVGDGGGAFLLQKSSDNERGIHTSWFKTIPEIWNNNVIWGGGVAFPGDPDKMYVPGTTKALTDAAAEAPYTIPKVLAAAGWTKEDLDYIVPTQVAKWIVAHISKAMDMDLSKFVEIVKDCGNMGASNVPLAAYRAWQDGRLHEGSKILMVGGAVGANIGMMTAIL